MALVDTAAERAANAGRSWLLWPPLYAVTGGAGLWMLLHRGQLAAVATNKVGHPAAAQMARWVALTLAALVVFYAVAAAWRRWRMGVFRVADTIGELNRRLRFLLALPLLPALAFPKIETEKPELTYFFAALTAAILGWTVYGWTRPPAPDPAQELWPEPPAKRQTGAKIAAFLSVAALWAGYGAFFSRLSITNHHA
ncbi:MAG TPA: hypothetical protein VLS89_12165, partial [Candidatus Nanopelagicales bacterium]|nr:hypothetical protein [Candidatus Nanopelagicales bacterium]